ncbi:MAG: hypothetical protein QOJ40_2899 [Verrucomicrobiota bacterium]
MRGGGEAFWHPSRVRIKPRTNRGYRRGVGFPSPPRVRFPKRDVRFAKCGLNPRLISGNPSGCSAVVVTRCALDYWTLKNRLVAWLVSVLKIKRLVPAGKVWVVCQFRRLVDICTWTVEATYPPIKNCI